MGFWHKLNQDTITFPMYTFWSLLLNMPSKFSLYPGSCDLQGFQHDNQHTFWGLYRDCLLHSYHGCKSLCQTMLDAVTIHYFLENHILSRQGELAIIQCTQKPQVNKFVLYINSRKIVPTSPAQKRGQTRVLLQTKSPYRSSQQRSIAYNMATSCCSGTFCATINVLGISTILLAFAASTSAGPVVPRQADSADYFDHYIHRLVSRTHGNAVSTCIFSV